MKENILWSARPSQIINWIKYIYMTILSIIWIKIPQNILNYYMFDKVYVYQLFLMYTFIMMVIIIIIAIKLYCNKYQITEERLIIYKGLLNRKREVLELYRVKDFSVYKPFYIRIFGYSIISIYASDKTTPIINLKGIKNGYCCLKIKFGQIK